MLMKMVTRTSTGKSHKAMEELFGRRNTNALSHVNEIVKRYNHTCTMTIWWHFVYTNDNVE